MTALAARIQMGLNEMPVTVAVGDNRDGIMKIDIERLGLKNVEVDPETL